MGADIHFNGISHECHKFSPCLWNTPFLHKLRYKFVFSLLHIQYCPLYNSHLPDGSVHDCLHRLGRTAFRCIRAGNHTDLCLNILVTLQRPFYCRLCPRATFIPSLQNVLLTPYAPLIRSYVQSLF